MLIIGERHKVSQDETASATEINDQKDQKCLR